MLTETITPHQNLRNNKIFGFWLYLMSDCILFATLFATYSVMVNNIANGPSGHEIFNLPFVLLETIFLLLSSMTHGLATIKMTMKETNAVIFYLGLTFLFGLGFIYMEVYEFLHLFSHGITPKISGFLSGYFTLVGTHGVHVISGMIWMLLLMLQIAIRGLTTTNCTRLMCLSLFWHFLDIVWICVFTIVYLIGGI
ncbi:cytochrome o ubiquinol oxidase subunit III [Candidatus Erwinia haradaeae]|uniref:Cytochrome bo(3) ubiquinol oxidase subunit 3 n=1 Tax=Candidatus Erwinia haradaeae TaxID=1922217 RepID=A0A451D395_9GAMM|nr:cytochrome o ubiquinol oxidase subunit III [Candidatus Erwinia haradaeae]VFP80131.1 Cytochrome bo(3) ubiquinol oxidase subunit 3 [Candidatus Erwinia haradaeae]